MTSGVAAIYTGSATSNTTLGSLNVASLVAIGASAQTGTLGGTGSSIQLASSTFLILSGTSGLTLNANSVEYARVNPGFAAVVFRGRVSLAATADGTPDLIVSRENSFADIRHNAGLRSRNYANSADAPVGCSDLNASGVAKFTGYPTGLLPAAASNAGSITYDTTLAKHVGCNGTTWNALW